MKAKEANFLEFMRGPKQFMIPIYQRTYSWTKKQCEQLWNDILRVAQDTTIPAHFVGSVVYIERGIYQVTSVPQLLVIDGQQRITTLSLLLCAVGNATVDGQIAIEISRRKINNYYLFNTEEDDELRYKLTLTQSDKETYFRLIDNREPPLEASQRIIENYRFFEEQIRKSQISLDTLFDGIGKLVIVDVSLDRNYDSPQLIFESMNSTGLDLSQADLIRNYILMGLEPKQQISLYNQFWFPMEQSFGQTGYTEQFNRFMRDFLTIKGEGTIPNINEVYAAFKTYAFKSMSRGTNIQQIVEDIERYSKHFAKIVLLSSETNSDIRTVLADIKELKVEVANPFLMEIYDDYQENRLSPEEFIEILKLIESYVFRRVICGIPTNSLNKTFANLSKEVDKNNYLESVRAVFLLKDSYRRFPGDEEFWKELTQKDVYNFRSRLYLLRKLENHGRKELVNVDTYTIEHIMPQNPNLPEGWRIELGTTWKDIHARYLHTIGNLTLTGYNPELSDKRFQEKRDMEGGFRDSPIRLNKSLASQEKWGQNEIEERARALADAALQIWPFYNLPTETLQKYRSQGVEDNNLITLEAYEYLQGEILSLFENLRVRILNLDAAVREEYKKLYIAYKTTTNFVDIVPQRSRLRLSLNMAFDEIDDPRGICRNVAGIGRWGNGEVEVGIVPGNDLEYILFLIRQSLAKHNDDMWE